MINFIKKEWYFWARLAYITITKKSINCYTQVHVHNEFQRDETEEFYPCRWDSIEQVPWNPMAFCVKSMRDGRKLCVFYDECSIVPKTIMHSEFPLGIRFYMSKWQFFKFKLSQRRKFIEPKRFLSMSKEDWKI